jgi:hypothetical protein
MLVISFFMETPFTTLRVALKQKGLSWHPPGKWSSLAYDSYVWQPDVDMVTDLFVHSRMTCHNIFRVIFSHPLGVVMQILLRMQTCSMKNFSHLSSSILDEHQDMAILEESKAHSTKRKYFHLGDFYKDSQMKRKHFSRPEPVPHLISSSQGNPGIFLGSLMSSQSSGSNDHANGDEYEPFSTYGSPLQRWIDQLVAILLGRISRMIRSAVVIFRNISSLPPISIGLIS